MKFKVGDIVIALKNPYGITYEGTVLEVIFINDDRNFTGKILEHEKKFEIGKEFSDLNEKSFKLLKSRIEEIKMENYEIIITDKDISIIDKDNDCITLSKEDFNKIYEEVFKK